MNREKSGFPSKKSKENAVLLLSRGKRGLLQIVFGRAVLVILLLILQDFVLYAAFYRL